MMTMNPIPLSDPTIQRLAWTLIHFLWQGLAIALLLIAVVRIGRIRQSSRRYACSLAALFAMLAMPFATYSLMTATLSSRVDTTHVVPQHEVTRPSIVDSAPRPRDANPVGLVPKPIGEPGSVVSTSIGPQSITSPSTPSGTLGWQWLQPWIVTAWFVGVAVLSLRLLLGWLGVFRLRRRTSPAPDWLVEQMKQLANQLQVASPLLRVGHRVTEAIAVGCLKPMILLPMAWVSEMPPDMLEAVLAHELAHIRRHDLWINLLQRLVETLLFYHPAVWWLSRRLRMERELCCDELVVQMTENPLRYAETLEHIGRLSISAQQAALAVSIGGPRSLLIERVRNILRLRASEQSSWAWLAAAVPLMLAGLLYASTLSSHRAIAQATDDPPTEKAQKKIDPSKAESKDEITLRGRVIDGDGKPVENADVMMFQTNPTTNIPPAKVLATKSGPKGVFELKGPVALFQSANVWSIVPWEQKWTGPALGWGVHPAHTYDTPMGRDGVPEENIPKDSPDRFVIRLNRKPGKIRVEDPKVAPVAGAKVTVVALSPKQKDTAHLQLELEAGRRLGPHLLNQVSFQEWIHVPIEFRRMLTGVTDAGGIVNLEGVEPDRIAGLHVETEAYGLQMVPRDGATRAHKEFYRFRLSPVGKIEGKVVVDARAAAAGYRAEGLRLNFRTSKPSTLRHRAQDEIDSSVFPDGWATAVVDATGSFSVPVIADGYLEIENPLPNDSSFALTPPLSMRVAANRSLKLTLPVNKRVKVQGVVHRRGSNKPFPGAKIRLTQFLESGFRNPHVRMVKSDDQGRYEALVQPGLIEITLQEPIDGWAPVHAWEHQHTRAEIGLHHEVPDSDAPIDLPALELVPTESITGVLLDQQGDVVESLWEVAGFPANSSLSCGQARPRTGGEFKLSYPRAYPPKTFMARRISRPEATAVQTHELKIVSEQPLILQFPGQPRQAPPLVGERKDELPKLNFLQLREARQKRIAGNDRDAAKKLVGNWKMILPAGFVYPMTITQREDGCLVLGSEKELNSRGVFTIKDKRLELIEPKRSEVDDFVWERQDDGSFKLIHEQHRHGGKYVGAILQQSPADPGAAEGAANVKVKLRRTRQALNDRSAATQLVGRWMLTLPSEAVFDIQLSQSEDGCLKLAGKKKTDLLGRYALSGNRLELIDDDRADTDFVWQVQDENRLKLIEERHQLSSKFVGAKLERIAATDEPKEGAAAKQSLFQIPQPVVEQARKLAIEWRQKQGDLKSRRPAGLGELDSPAAIRQAIDKAIADLADNTRQYDGLQHLRFLGDVAFDALVVGAKSTNPQVAKWSCVVLQHHGLKAVPALSEATRSYPDAGVRAAAANSLGQTFQPTGVPALIDALTDADSSVRVAAMHSIKYPRDQRAIEPLKRLVDNAGTGHVAVDSIQHILKEQGYVWWPPETLELWQLCQDAQTLKREKFGEAERKRLIEGLSSANGSISYLCLFALGHLDARETIPAILQVPDSQMKFHVLAQIGTPEAFEYLVQRLQSLHPLTREAAILGLADGADRWAAPLLIALLDDPSLKVPAQKDPNNDVVNIGRQFLHAWPEWNRAHAALFQFFSRFGLHGRAINLATGQGNNVPEEIARLKAWWQTHGADFLAGKKVPNPELTTVLYSS